MTPTMSAQRRRGVVGALLIVGLLAALGLLFLAVRGGASSDLVSIEVPPGTAQRMAEGEDVELMPRVLRVEVGDELVITNHDDQVHTVGPYTIAADQTLRQRFTTAGTIVGICTLHPSGEVSIVVS